MERTKRTFFNLYFNEESIVSHGGWFYSIFLIVARGKCHGTTWENSQRRIFTIGETNEALSDKGESLNTCD